MLSRYLLLIAGFTFFFSISKAQDTIVKLDSSKITAKVLKIGSAEVEYKKPGNADGPTYVISASEIARIRYANGASDVFIQPKKENSTVPDKAHKSYMERDTRNNSITLNGFDLMFGVYTLKYMRNLNNDFIAIRIPVSTGAAFLGGNAPQFSQFSYNIENYYSKYKIFSSGFDLLAFPAGQGFASYYLGPSVEIGTYYYYTLVDPYTSAASYARRQDSFVSFGAINGVLLRPMNQMDIAIDFSLGMVHASRTTSYNAMSRLGVSMGWRF